jgi:mono/diheme cytochrome c family protein
MRNFLGGLLTGVILLPLGFFLLLRAGLWPVSATAEPSSLESTLAVPSLRASVKRRAPAQQNPVEPTEENLRVGMKLFKNDCAGCHGDGSGPSYWGTRSFYPRVPQFAQQPSQLTAAQMFWVVKHGVRYTGMAAWDGMLTDKEIWQAVTFLSQLDHLPASVAEEFRRKS